MDMLMIACEILLLGTLAVTLCISGYTDFHRGIIENRLLIRCLCISVPLDVLYYGMWARDLLPLFIVSTSLVSAISIMLYAYHIWAAGDSKLLIVITLCIPGRLLTPFDIGPFPTFWIIVGTFVSAFFYLVVDALARSILQGGSTLVRPIHFDSRRYVSQWLAMVAAMMILSNALARLAPQLYVAYPSLTFAINFCLVLTLSEVRGHTSEQSTAVAAVVMWGVLIALSVARVFTIPLGMSIRSVVLIALITCAQLLAGRYNYQIVPTETVVAGQIPAAQTVLAFQSSRVAGLPQGITEDMRSRLSESEAASVRRWGTSAHGRPTIVIVRKIPFALFIGVGVLAFVAAEGALLWL